MNFQLSSPALNPNKSVGPNSIPTKILKALNDEIYFVASFWQLQCFIFCGSIRISPQNCKVIPVYQKDSKLDCSNHCPVSFLRKIKKAIEKRMYNRK